MASETPATRALEARGIAFARHVYDYDPTAERVGLLEKFKLFLGEVQRRLDQHAQLDQAVAQRLDAPGEVA